MDRHVIANMGAELGATTTVFPADDAVRGHFPAGAFVLDKPLDAVESSVAREGGREVGSREGEG